MPICHLGWGQLQCNLVDYEKKKVSFLEESWGTINGRKGNESWTGKKTTEEYYNFLIISSHNPMCGSLAKA